MQTSKTIIKQETKPPLKGAEFKFDFVEASNRLKHVVNRTPLELNLNLSEKYQANIYFKREDQQVVRSYKIRGAYNLMSGLTPEQLSKGVVCASAGNHAQGFAFACKKLGAFGVAFMPLNTPNQKINQTKRFGQNFISIKLVGHSYDETAVAAQLYASMNGMKYVHPFDDNKIIEGQGTVGVEILEDLSEIDFVFIPVGGGGLCSGVGRYFQTVSPGTKIIGVEPAGAPSMNAALKAGKPVTLQTIDRFVDGAAVQRVGDITFSICREVISEMHLVPEGKICSAIRRLYNEEAMVVEPAGVLSVAALDDYAFRIKGKNVVCIISGGNNDIDRLQEINKRAVGC